MLQDSSLTRVHQFGAVGVFFLFYFSMKRFNHRCKSCWHPWYTDKRDAQALCPKCQSQEIDLYVHMPKSLHRKGTRFELILILTVTNLVLLVAVVALLTFLLG